jgi:hypothetical protein
MNNKIHDKYATKPRTIKPIFIRAIKYFGQLQINVRRIDTTPFYNTQSQRDQVASDSTQKQQRYRKKNTINI